jgi:NTP pyrophosphatase (non-canonical NTP hydrolase)
MVQTDYDVAISFAGEDRPQAEELASALQKLAIRVFYDRDEKADLWGKDLYAYLTDLYRNRARFCIMLISEHYASKLWTTQERRAMQEHALRQDGEYILPIRLDDTEIPGLLSTTAYLCWPPETAGSIADAVQLKLNQIAHSAAGPQAGSIGGAKRTTKHALTIQQFQLSLDGMYGKANRGQSVEYTFGYLSQTVGYLSKAVSQREATEQDFIRPISWLVATASKVGTDVQDAFISRYPNLCPSCAQPRCVCFRTAKKPPNDMPAYRVKEELYLARNTIINRRSPVTFDFAMACIGSVFPNNEIIWRYAGPGFHFSKVAEEVAEVHEAISGLLTGKKKLSALSDEIADVLAWLLGAWHIALPDKSVDQEIISYYFNGCPVCQRKQCVCSPYSGRPQNLFDSAVLADVEKDLVYLRDASPEDRQDIEELQKSVRVVVDTQDDPMARLTLNQLTLKLTRARDAHTGKDGAEIVIPIISVILQKLEKAYRQ